MGILLLVIFCVLLLLALAGGGLYYYFSDSSDTEESGQPSAVVSGDVSSSPVAASRIAVKIGAQIRLHNKTGDSMIYMTRPEDTTNLSLFKKGARVRFSNLQTVDKKQFFPEVTKTLTADVRWDLATGSIYNSLQWDPVSEPASLPEHVLADVEVS